MPILTKIAGMFGGQIVDALLGNVTGLFKAYFDKKISEAELRAKVLEALMASFADVEKAYADSVTKTFGSFMEAASKSKLMQATWAAVCLSQLCVVLWHQVGIPALMFWGYPGLHYPSAGTTADWANAMVLFCLGGGAYSQRSAGGGMLDKLKDLMGRTK